MDVAVAAAQRLDIKLIPDLIWNPFAIVDNCHEPLSFLFDRNAGSNSTLTCSRQLASDYITNLVTRYANSTAILFWELSNENNALVDGYLANSTVACDRSRGTPAHRTDSDNFDSKQMIETHEWMAGLVLQADPGSLVSSGQSMPVRCGYLYKIVILTMYNKIYKNMYKNT